MSCQFVGCGFSVDHFVGIISQEAAEDRADDRERSASPLHEPTDAAKDPETQTSFCFCFVCLFLFHLEPVSSMSGWFWMSDCVLSICRVWFQCSSFCRDHISGSC